MNWPTLHEEDEGEKGHRTPSHLGRAHNDEKKWAKIRDINTLRGTRLCGFGR